MTSLNRDWVKPYLDLMVSENFEDSLTLKAQHFPNSFFRYRKLNANTADSLASGEIWLATLSSLNDPFECSLQFDNNACWRILYSSEKFWKGFKERFGFKFSDKEIEKIIKSNEPYITYSKICDSNNIQTLSSEEQYSKVQKRWVEILDEASKIMRVCCFSEFNDSLLMWSHYAEEHKGICIEYDFIDIDEIRAFLQPIIYDKNIYKISTFEDLTTTSIIRATLTKCMDWEYEAEWRLTILQKDDVLRDKIEVPKPKAIYLGTRFHQNDEALKAQFMQVISKMNIPYYEMVKHPTEYRLVKK